MRCVGQIVVTVTVRKGFHIYCRCHYHYEPGDEGRGSDLYIDLIEPLTADAGLGDEASDAVTAAMVEAAIQEMGE